MHIAIRDSRPKPRPIDSRRDERFCVLGAGSSGLAAAKNLRARGIPFDCLEREFDIGGNWNLKSRRSGTYRSTRMISSKALTEYPDFPMPADYPDYPDREQVGRYLQAYAREFELYSHIEFGIAVRRVDPTQDGWCIALENGERRRYRGIIIANGHNWDPRWPVYPGYFAGEILHSVEYKHPEQLVGRRVLVVGGGNSGFDIAAESSRHATATFHSLRRGYRVLPRYHKGQPVDTCGEWMLRWRLPLWFRRLSAARACKLAWGHIWPRHIEPLRPDHRFWETHPVINGTWPEDVARGKISVRPGVKSLTARGVVFSDGTREHVDTIIFATGYRASFPFMRHTDLNWRNGRPQLYLNVFHPQRDNLFVIGLIQPDSGQFGLVHCQAELVAAYLQGLATGTKAARNFRREKGARTTASNGGVRYVDTPRHWFEVEHYSYRQTLERWIRRLA